jgi:cytochrome P450
VINTDGDTWRLHRRVTGQAFSERLHRAVWQEGVNQARFMMESWLTSNESNLDSLRVSELERDALHLTLNVITGAAYGYPLKWNENPQCASPTSLSYHAAVVQFTAHLMPIFLTPRWLLRLARKDSIRGRAWEACTAFESYMRGMLDRQRTRLGAAECTDENLLTVLIRSQDQEDDKASKKMTAKEVMGNTFIFLFAGHETTANTLHYSLLLLAQRQDVQQSFLTEVDDMYEKARQDGRCELDYDLDFNRARWALAIMVRGKRNIRIVCLTSILWLVAVRNT